MTGVQTCALPIYRGLVVLLHPPLNKAMVRLITQHLLACPVKTCSYPSNFPLSFQNVETIQVVEAEFNEEFMRGFVGRLEWDALRKSAAEVSARRREEGGQLARSWGRSTECELTCLSCTQLGNTDLPEASPDLSQPQDIPIELLHVLHHVLLEVRSSSPSGYSLRPFTLLSNLSLCCRSFIEIRRYRRLQNTS
mgnify:FL=1